MDLLSGFFSILNKGPSGIRKALFFVLLGSCLGGFDVQAQAVEAKPCWREPLVTSTFQPACSEAIPQAQILAGMQTKEGLSFWAGLKTAWAPCIKSQGSQFPAKGIAKVLEKSGFSSFFLDLLEQEKWNPATSQAMEWAEKSLGFGRYNLTQRWLELVPEKNRYSEWYYLGGRAAFRLENYPKARDLFTIGSGVQGYWARRNQYQAARLTAFFLNDLAQGKSLYQPLASKAPQGHFAMGACINLIRIGLLTKDDKLVAQMDQLSWTNRRNLSSSAKEEMAHLALANPSLNQAWAKYSKATFPRAGNVRAGADRGLKVGATDEPLTCLIEEAAWAKLGAYLLGPGKRKHGSRQSYLALLLAGRNEPKAQWQVHAAEVLKYRGRDLYPKFRPDLMIPLCSIHDVPESFVLAIYREESRFKEDVLSAAGALGVAQLMPLTAESLLPVENRQDLPESLMRAEVAMPISVSHLAELVHKYKGRLDLAAAAYNAGESTVDRWVSRFPKDPELFWHWIPYRETRRYVTKVLRSYYAYEELARREAK